MSKYSSEVPQIEYPPIPSELSISKAAMMVCGVQTLAKYTTEIYRDSLRALMKGKKPHFPGLPARFSAESAELAEDFMDIDVETHGDFPALGKDERGIIISNHPNDPYLWPWANVACQKFSQNLRAVAKKEMLYDPRTLPPILGWPATLGQMMMPVDRRDRSSAVASIREGCEKIFQPGDAAFIFPDTHRPTRSRVEASHAKMTEDYPDLPESMPHTCFPRSGGLMTILSATDQYPTRILNMTVGSNVDEERLGSILHIHGEGVEREALVGESSNAEEQEAHLRQWLVEEWKRKNERIEAWRVG
jgi:hypothetical protein